MRLGIETTSEWKDINRGCPQRSTFGPLLRIIFQNDLTFNVCNCPLSLYADDHQLHAIGRGIQDVERTLNDEDNNVSNCRYSINALQGNFLKYQAIRFGLRSTDRDINIVITDTPVENYPILELLGVPIDGQMISKIMLVRLRKRHRNKLEFCYVCIISYHSRLSSESTKLLYQHY